MSDFEDAGFCLESWTQPEKKKEKNECKKKRKDPKHKNKRGQKRQKTPKFNETIMETNVKMKETRKRTKKGKKKMKKKMELDYFTSMLVTGDQAEHLEELEASNRFKNKKVKSDNQDQQSKKKTRKKKMVAFGLSPVQIRIKRPKFALKEMEAVREGNCCSQASVAGYSQIQPQDDGVQCASDEINSQDLFITQKTFRASPAEPSSSEASDRPTAASPPVFKQQNKGWHAAEREIKHKHPLNSYSYQLSGASHKLVQELETVDTAEDEKTQLEKSTFQRQRKLKANVYEAKKASLSLRPKAVNPFLDEPVIINPTTETSSNQRSSSFPPQVDELSPLPPQKVSTSTQTENFFTCELSSYLSFCQRNPASLHCEDFQVWDLSLPQRARKDLRLSINMSGTDVRDGADTLHDQKRSVLPGKMTDKRGVDASGSPQTKDDEVKEISGQIKGNLSPQSDAELKFADMTTSSEDDHHYNTSRKDPIKVKGIQMKLNKPFFFKTKGDRRSPRPESPLMRLSQDIPVKKRR